MTLPVLYSFRRCPFAMRARMALDVAEIEVEHREVLLRDKPQPMLDASPKGTVPILVLNEGHVIDESLDIMLWALNRNDPEGWLKDNSQKAFIETFLKAFKPKLDRYKYASRYSDRADRGSTDSGERDRAFELLNTDFAPLQAQLFFGGDAPDLTDIALFPFMRQFANVEPNWWAATAPACVQAWLTKHVGSERFLRIMIKHRVWQVPTT